MWSRRSVTEDANGNKTYSDGYHVIDAATEEEALATSGLPVRNQQRSSGSPYRVRGRSAQPYNGPTQWIVTVEYAIPTNGTFPETPTENPLTRVMRWTVQASYIERANEMDAKRRLKKNSAGDMFPPIPSQYRRRTLIGTRVERFWDINKSRKFENKTNANRISLGPVSIEPFEAMCESIEPVGDFTANDEWITMQYAITIAVDERATPPENSNNPPISGYPFEQHQLDIGNFGWYNNAAGQPRLGRFCYASGTTATSIDNFVEGDADDVQLDGKGKPISDKIYCRSGDSKLIFAPINNPIRSEWLTGGDYATGRTPTASPYSSDTNPMWLFLNHVAIDWTDIFALSGTPTAPPT